MTDGIDVWGTVFELEHAHHGNIAVVILGTRKISLMPPVPIEGFQFLNVSKRM